MASLRRTRAYVTQTVERTVPVSCPSPRQPTYSPRSAGAKRYGSLSGGSGGSSASPVIYSTAHGLTFDKNGGGPYYGGVSFPCTNVSCTPTVVHVNTGYTGPQYPYPR